MTDEWRERPEGGGRFGLWLIFTLARLLGRPLTRLILFPVTLYFYLRRGYERRAARTLLTRLGHPAGVWRVMAHIHHFAGTLLDRVFFLDRGERGFAIDIQGLDLLRSTVARGRGMLLLSAHMGSFEALRIVAEHSAEAPPLRIVLNKRKMPVMTGLMRRLAPELDAAIIDASRDPVSIVLALSEALQRGEVVALLADRARPGEATLRVPFGDGTAPFPLGPWELAAALRVPVVLALGLYRGGNRYELVFEPFAERIELPRQGREAALVPILARYAARLEHYARQRPCNWFNFYDFWADADADDAGVGERGL